MTKKLIGRVTEEERDEIQTLFERRNGLKELASVVDANNSELYERLIADMGETGSRFQKWWDTMAAKYDWERAINGNWEIDFGTCDIYLVEP